MNANVALTDQEVQVAASVNEPAEVRNMRGVFRTFRHGFGGFVLVKPNFEWKG